MGRSTLGVGRVISARSRRMGRCGGVRLVRLRAIAPDGAVRRGSTCTSPRDRASLGRSLRAERLALQHGYDVAGVQLAGHPDVVAETDRVELAAAGGRPQAVGEGGLGGGERGGGLLRLRAEAGARRGRPGPPAPRRRPRGPRPPGAANRRASARRRRPRPAATRTRAAARATGPPRSGCAGRRPRRSSRCPARSKLIDEPLGEGSTSRSSSGAASTLAGDSVTPASRAAAGQRGAAVGGVLLGGGVAPAVGEDRDAALGGDGQGGRERQHVDHHREVARRRRSRRRRSGPSRSGRRTPPGRAPGSCQSRTRTTDLPSVRRSSMSTSA